MPGTTAWELAVECVEETLASGGAPSLGRLGRLGQLGSLPALAGALRTGVNPARVALAHAREREGLGFAPSEVAAELLRSGGSSTGMESGLRASGWTAASRSTSSASRATSPTVRGAIRSPAS